jgi:hypothetical protein
MPRGPRGHRYLSKIEAGQLTLDLADYSLKDVVDTVVSAVESLANGKKLALIVIR